MYSELHWIKVGCCKWQNVLRNIKAHPTDDAIQVFKMFRCFSSNFCEIIHPGNLSYPLTELHQSAKHEEKFFVFLAILSNIAHK